MPFGTVTFTEWDEAGFLSIQVDADGDGGAGACQGAHSFGFLGRPHDPGADGVGCTVDKRRLGSEHFAWLGDDPRSVAWLPRCTKGGSAQYGGPLGKGLTWREIDGDTGSIVDYVPTEWDGNGVPTAAHKLEVGVDGNGAPVVQIIHAEGMALVMFDGSATLADATGQAWVAVGASGVTVSGPLKATSGIDIGGTGGIPLTLQPPLATALGAFCAAINAATAAPDGSGAAVLAALKVAATALAAALPGTASTMAKSL